jgi:multiple sugar transport system substrate-binding protein
MERRAREGAMTEMGRIFERPMTRRQVMKTGIGIGGVALAAPLLAACTSGDGGGGGGGGGGSGKVLLGTFDDPLLDGFKNTIIPLYKEETGIEVELLIDDFTTFFQKGLNDGISQAGEYDIYFMDDGWVPQYASTGILANLGKEGVQADSEFVPEWLDLGYWPPKTGPRIKGFEDDEPVLIGVPAVGDFETLTYRTDVFPSAPKTWDELVQIAQQKQDPAKGQYGFVFRGAVGNAIAAAWYNVALAFGATHFDDQWNVTFNDEVGTRTGKFLIETLGPLAPPGVVEFDSTQEAASFLGGESFSAIQYSGNAMLQDQPDQTKVFGKTAHATVPKDVEARGQSGIWVAGISTSAPNREGAVKFLQWYTQTRVQVEMVRAGTTPVKTPAFEDAKAQADNPWLPVASEQIALGLGSKPRTGDWSKVEELLSTELNIALQRGTLGDALDVAATKTTDYLTQQGYYS